MMSHIISVQEFKAIQSDENLKVFDVRYGINANEAYDQLHIENAIFADLDKQLSEIGNPAEGGRHPLPSVARFVTQLGKWGVANTSRIVLYDNSSGALAAARMWWMLKSIGHKKVQVLNGGLQKAIESGVKMNSYVPIFNSTIYKCELSRWQWPTVDISHVGSNLNSKTQAVIDVRATNRFEGIEEPIDPIAGHIPGAVNIPLTQNTNEEGLFKPPNELNETYAAQFTDTPPIFHCGSGVTACHSILATQIAGLPLPKLYVGSWSEWSRSEQKKITKN